MQRGGIEARAQPQYPAATQAQVDIRLLTVFKCVWAAFIMAMYVWNVYFLLYLQDWTTPTAAVWSSLRSVLIVALAFLLAGTLMWCIIETPLRAILYLPVLFYRLSLKATSICYFPLLLLIQQSTSKVPLQLQLEQVRDGKWAALRRRMAWLFGGIVVMKIVAYSLQIRLVENWDASALGQFARLVVLPYSLPAWQVATLVNAIIVIGFYYLVDLILWRYRRGDKVAETGVLALLRCVIIVTGFLGIYTTVANVWIILHHEPFLRVPPIGVWWPVTENRH